MNILPGFSFDFEFMEAAAIKAASFTEYGALKEYDLQFLHGPEYNYAVIFSDYDCSAYNLVVAQTLSRLNK